MIDWTEISQAKVVVLGAAKSGIAAATFLVSRVKSVWVSEYALISEDNKHILEASQVPFEEGGHTQERVLDADWIVVSPGIPLTAPPVQWARTAGIPVISEIELAAQFLKTRTLAVTGSNGKTTTVSLLKNLLTEAGYAVESAGNIGTPLISLVEAPLDYIVVELSSFQLETTYTYAPDIALLLNIYPNHLNRHLTMEAYFEAKTRIFQAQTSEQWALINTQNDWTAPLGEELNGQVARFGNPGERAYVEDGVLMASTGKEPWQIAAVDTLPLPGKHNIENYLAVTACATILDIAPDVLKRALMAFKGVSHRLEYVRTLAEVRFVNDSKATNYLATEMALACFQAPVILIAGGEDKGGDFEPLAQLIQSKVKAVHLIGEAASYFEESLKSRAYHATSIHATMKEAVEASFGAAQAQDVVLLSPACASYDMYANFEERGEDFKRCVHSLSVS